MDTDKLKNLLHKSLLSLLPMLINYFKKKFNSQSFIIVLLLFIVWRTIQFTITYYGPSIISQWGNRFPYVNEQLKASGLPYWIWSWGNFDGVHYLTIAKTYYSANYTQTFFPLYPLLIRLFAKIFINNHLLIALIVSNLSFLGMLYFLKKLVSLDGYKNYYFWIVLFVMIFPTSFYFAGVYSESLFLLLVIASFYFARISKWFLASLLAGISSFTRLFGIFMVFGLLTEYIYGRDTKKITKTIPLLILILVPLGLLLYMGYLFIAFKDPLLFWHAQPVFGAARSGSSMILPFQVIFRYLKIFFTVNPLQLGFWNAFYEFSSFIFAVGMLIIAHKKKIRLSYLIFSWFCLIIPSLTGTLSSLPRYILIIFPIYIVLGILQNKTVKCLLLIFFAFLQIISLVLFTRGYWIA